MGPVAENTQSRAGSSSSRNSALDPPPFTSEIDLYVWRKRVANWVDLISTAAKQGSDKTYQTVFATLARHLYARGLTSEQQSVVDEAQAKGVIDFRQPNQVKGVQDIVNLLAVDPPIAVVTRLITSFNKVTSCTRQKKENLNRFVDRFRGLASDHLMHAGASSSSQIGEVLAITLLNNANLEDGTLTNAKMQLIALAEARKIPDESSNEKTDISNEIKMRVINAKLLHFKELSTVIRAKITRIEDQSRKQFREQNREARGFLTSLLDDIDNVDGDLKKEFENIVSDSGTKSSNVFDVASFSSPHKYTLRLDDAVSVVRSLAVTSQSKESSFTRHEVQNIVQEKVQKALLSMAANETQKPRSSGVEKLANSQPLSSSIKRNRRGLRPSKKPDNGKKADNSSKELFCFDCGDTGVRRGHDDCKTPSFMTRKLKREADSQPEQKEASGNVGCPKSVGGIESIAILCEALGVQVELSDLDCDPFLHGYGNNCADARMVYATWRLKTTDMKGTKCEIPFYVVQGDGPLLLGNNVLACSNLLGSENILVIPAKAGEISDHELVFRTFTSQLRTFLHLIPSHVSNFNTFFSSGSALISRNKSNGMSYSSLGEGKQAKEFATRLHSYTHLHPTDMISICRSANLSNPILDQALRNSFEKCTTCKMTGLPKHSRKISFNRILTNFNHRLQMDFMYIKEMGKEPILHLCDAHTSFSVAVQLPSRDMHIVCQTLRTHWFDVYGPPAEIMGDPEFDNGYVRNMLGSHDCEYRASPARRHNKIGVVESNHRMIRLLTERLFVDAAYNHRTHGTQITSEEILSRAVFLKNILRGGKKLSPFELAKGYSPSLKGIPQSLLPRDIVDAHFQQVARRTISRFLSKPRPLLVNQALLQPKTEIYYWVKSINKGGSWKRGYVKEALPQLVMVQTHLHGRGASRKIAYEDIRIAPSSSLLKDLEAIEISESQRGEESSDRGLGSADQSEGVETALFVIHPNHVSYFTELSGRESEPRSIAEDSSKDIGHSTIPNSPNESTVIKLKSMEQEILSNVLNVLGTDHVTMRELDFLPQWVIDKAIRKELENYSGGYEERKISTLSPSANVISSHAFFHVKKDGDEDALRLKCRLVPHGNRDKDKDKVRSDCATAQFPVIRLILSLSALFPFTLGSIDITVGKRRYTCAL